MKHRMKHKERLGQRPGTGACLALTTVAKAADAERIARTLVEERLAACVSQVPGLTSTYRWEGALRAEPEILLLIKTRASLIPAIEARFARLHPYETPELIALPVASGGRDYLSWLMAGTRG